jgi:hypothetical protein
MLLQSELQNSVEGVCFVSIQKGARSANSFHLVAEAHEGFIAVVAQDVLQ